MKFKVKVMTASFAMILASACAKEEDQAPAIDPQIALRNELIGTWQSNCIEGQTYSLSSIANIGITQRSRIEVTEDEITEVATITSSACDGNDIEITVKGKREAKDLQQPDIRGLTVTIDSYFVKPTTEFGVRVLNISKWCGFSEWELNKEHDVTPDLGKEKCFSLKGLNTVYAVQGSTLYFGGPNTLASSTAPTTKDLRKIFYFNRL